MGTSTSNLLRAFRRSEPMERDPESLDVSEVNLQLDAPTTIASCNM